MYCFCDNFKAGEIINGKKVIGFPELKSINLNSGYSIILSTDVNAIREQLEQVGLQYYEYIRTDNNFFNQEDIMDAMDKELYNQYSKLDNYSGKQCRSKNWYRTSYYSEDNKKLVNAMEDEDSCIVSQMWTSAYDNKILFEDEYFENRPGMRLITNIIKNDKRSTIKVCDLACGHGTFLKNLKCNKIECYGFDVSFERCHALNAAGIECKTGMLEHSTYKNESFDYVTMMECLEHVSDPFAAMKEAYRILKRAGGQIFVTVPYGENCDDPMHVRQFYEDDLFSIAKECGFKNIKIMQLPYINKTFDDNLLMSAKRSQY